MSLLDFGDKVEGFITTSRGRVSFLYFCSIEDVRALENRLKFLLRRETLKLFARESDILWDGEIYDGRQEARLVLSMVY